MNQFALSLILVGGFILVVNLLTHHIRRRFYMSEALLALAYGMTLGPEGLNLLPIGDSEQTRMFLGHAARITVGLAVMDVALSLPARYFATHRKPIAIILGPGMLAMWALTSGMTYLLGPFCSLKALAVGAVLTPTDPVLATAIVEGEAASKRIPTRLRHFLLAESAANDGLAFPLVMLPLLMLSEPEMALQTWVWDTLALGLFASVGLGAAVGYGVAKLLDWAYPDDSIEPASLLTLTVALTLLVSGLVDLYHGAEILAVFVAGLVFDRSFVSKEQVHAERVQESFRRFLELPVFILFGITLPWAEWSELGWWGPTLAVSALLFRRIPMVMLLGPVLGMRRRKERWFYGWFGPMGIAPLGFAVLLWERTQDDALWAICSLVIAASIVAHGITATPFAKSLDTGDEGSDA